jgi:imidazolonepropionase-like amidohydrolase
MNRFLAVAVSLLTFIATLPGQTTPKTTVIHAGRLLDVKSGKILSNQTIIIQGDKIVQVGGIYDQFIAGGSTVIDMPNATVMPGLIDAHTHITFTTNFGYSRLGISVPREALTGARNARVTLEAGYDNPQCRRGRIRRCGFA